tara:strand:+ start:153 stop:290 length:138 start_codon:yes stop_codon:yes gene_type:complete
MITISIARVLTRVVQGRPGESGAAARRRVDSEDLFIIYTERPPGV